MENKGTSDASPAAKGDEVEVKKVEMALQEISLQESKSVSTEDDGHLEEDEVDCQCQDGEECQYCDGAEEGCLSSLIYIRLS